MPKVISVHSYRGGTGKSNFTANLATTVARQGYRVAVVDTDVPSPGIHNIFCLDTDAVSKTLNTYLWGESAITEAAYDVGSPLGLADGSLFLVPASAKADDIARILLDYLFIDTHPGLSKETFLSIAISHVLILILRPDKQDYQGTAVTMDVARQLKVRKMLLAINKVYSSLNPDALKQKVEETYATPVAGVFPSQKTWCS